MATYRLTSNIPYLPSSHEQFHSTRHLLDLYLPIVPPPSLRGYPLLIYIHGGAFKHGSKQTELLPFHLLTTHTLAIASLNYRLSGDATFPAAVEDVRAATRYLHATSHSFNLDNQRFIAMGESAGAYMALMIGIPGPGPVPLFDTLGDHLDVPCQVAGVIDFYGPTEFLSMDDQAPEGSTLRHNPPYSPESLFLGSPITQVPDLVRQASPLEYVGEWTPPVLVCHGTGDVVVPLGQSRLLVKKLREVGRKVTVHEVEGVDHVWKGISEEQRAELNAVVDRWVVDLFGKGGW